MTLDIYNEQIKNLPIELKLICDLFKTREEEQLESTIIRYKNTSNINWNLFVEYAKHHRVYPLLYDRLISSNTTIVPKEVMDQLRKMNRNNTFRMMQLTAELKRINELFNENGIRSLILKGPVLSQKIFGKFTARTSKDLDIYVPIKDIDLAEILLKKEGYVATYNNDRVGKGWEWREHHLSYTNSTTRIQIEMHWRLSPETDSEPSFEELWNRRDICTISGDEYNTLSNEDQFMYLVGHGARHGWFRVRWLLDIHELLLTSNLDMNAVELLVRKYNNTQFTTQALILSSLLFGTKIPNNFNSFTREVPESIVEDVILFISNTSTTSTLNNRYKFQLFKLKTGKQKILYLISRAYPNSWDVTLLPLPRQLYFMYFLFHPFFAVWRQMKKISLFNR